MSRAAYSTGAEIKEVSTSQLVTLVASYWQASTNIAAKEESEKPPPSKLVCSAILGGFEHSNNEK